MTSKSQMRELEGRIRVERTGPGPPQCWHPSLLRVSHSLSDQCLASLSEGRARGPRVVHRGIETGINGTSLAPTWQK
eukprot:2235129-Rhodomonas_salina.11